MMLDRVIARLQALRAELGRDVPVLVLDPDANGEFDFCLHVETFDDGGASVCIDTTGVEDDNAGQLPDGIPDDAWPAGVEAWCE